MAEDLLKVQNCHLRANKLAVLSFDEKYLCNSSLKMMVDAHSTKIQTLMRQVEQLPTQKKQNEEEKQDNDEEIVVEDPDQIEAGSLEKIGPHSVIHSLLDLFKFNGKVVQGSVPQN